MLDLYPRGVHYERYFIVLDHAKRKSITWNMAREELFNPQEDLSLPMPALSAGERAQLRRRYRQLVARDRSDDGGSL